MKFSCIAVELVTFNSLDVGRQHRTAHLCAEHCTSCSSACTMGAPFLLLLVRQFARDGLLCA